MTTSEPTTGEIVRALRVCDVGRCIDCNLDEKYPCENLKTYAADRLESQERENERLKEQVRCYKIRSEAEKWPDWKKEAYNSLATSSHAKKLELTGNNDATIAALTARAEQAEQDRDLAIKALADYEDAIDPTVEQIMREFHGTEQRGQPQDGEGK